MSLEPPIENLPAPRAIDLEFAAIVEWLRAHNYRARCLRDGRILLVDKASNRVVRIL